MKHREPVLKQYSPHAAKGLCSHCGEPLDKTTKEKAVHELVPSASAYSVTSATRMFKVIIYKYHERCLVAIDMYNRLKDDQDRHKFRSVSS